MSFSLVDQEPQKPSRPWIGRRIVEALTPTVRYWMGLDSHVYAMAIAGNVLFGFFPFMVLILSLSDNVLGWAGAERAIYVGLRGFLPEDPGLVTFVERNLRAAVESRGAHVEFISVLLLVLASNGIFMPLEVAQNRLWGFRKHRHYLFNQVFAFAMTMVCGLLALAAALFASVNTAPVRALFGDVAGDTAVLIALKLFETPFLFVIFLLVYWVLPNGPVPRERALPTAAVVAVAIELGQLAYSWIWPWLDLRTEYGPFFISVTLLLWGFLAAMIVLAGAEVCSRPARRGAPPSDQLAGGD